MAINNPSYELDNEGGTVSSKTPENYIYFKDSSFELHDYMIDAGDDTDIAFLEQIFQSAGFSGFGSNTNIGVWQIKNIGQNNLVLEWTGDLTVKSTGLHCLKCKSYDHTYYNLCLSLDSDEAIILNTGAIELGNNRYRIYVNEFGFATDRNKVYRNNNNFLPYVNLANSEKKIYNKTYSTWPATNKTKYLGPAYTYEVPNYFVQDKVMEGSAWISQNIPSETFKFEKKVEYPYINSTDAKNFGFQKYLHLLFNNFGSTFSDGSTMETPLTLKYTANKVTLTYGSLTKEVPLADNDFIIVYVREPAVVKSTAKCKWHYYCYGDRDWYIQWKEKFDVYYENGTVPDDVPQHSFEGETNLKAMQLMKFGTYEFKGGLPEEPGEDFLQIDNDSDYVTKFITTKTYTKEEKISKSSYDGRVYNTAFMSAGPTITFRAQNPYSADMAASGTTLSYTEEQTKHTFKLTYHTFIWEDGPTFTWTKGADTWWSLLSWSGDDNHCWLNSYMVWRCVGSDIGFVQWGYAKDPQTFTKYDTWVDNDSAKINAYKTPTGYFKYHNTDFYNIDAEIQSEYTESSYSQGEKPNVRGGFSFGLLLNTQNLTHVSSKEKPFEAASGVTNESAIAVLLFSDIKDIGDLSSFNRRNK